MEWKTVKLGDICEIFGRIGFRGYTIEDFVEKPSDGAITLSPTNIVDGAIDLSNCKYVNWKKYEESPEIMIQKGDIVIVKTGSSIGRTAYFRDVPHPITINPQFVVLKNINIDSLYLAYYVKSAEFQGNLQSIVVGSAIPTLSQKNLAKLPIPHPSLEDQRRIAAILSSLDDKIENNNRINANLEAQAQALFKRWFIDFEPLGGEMPKDWKEGTLGDIITEIESGSRPKGGAETCGIPSIGAEKIERFGVYEYTGEKYVNNEYFAKMKRGHVKDGDVLLYKDGAYTGKTSMALDGFPYETCAVNEHVFLLRTESSRFQFFLYFLMSYPDVKKVIHTLASAKAAQPGLNQSEVLGVDIIVPSTDSINLFNELIAPSMHLIAANAIESARLAAMRDTLLPKLMKGEIEL